MGETYNTAVCRKNQGGVGEQGKDGFVCLHDGEVGESHKTASVALKRGNDGLLAKPDGLLSMTEAKTEAENEDEDDGTVSASLKLDTYTISLISIFVFQIFFCFGICCWTKAQVNNAKKETVKQQADFYQFLYQFHKQMAEEEQAIHAAYGKAGGKTPQ